MIKNDLLVKKIAILGYGVNNQALLKWLVNHGAKNITICDRDIDLKNKINKEFLHLQFQLGGNYLDGLEKFDIAFRTPGIPYLHPKIQEAKAHNVEISSQTKLFFALSPAKIIGVTGTKGKGTTSTLIQKILSQNKNNQTYLAGNIGADPFEFLDQLLAKDWVILELSSFQLQDLDISPHIAVVLNVTSDHLDYHRDTIEYIEAKTNIVRHQKNKDFAVINMDYMTSFCFAEMTNGRTWYFSRYKAVDFGAYVKNNDMSCGEIILQTEDTEYVVAKLEELKLKGEHNLENICAAVTASYLSGASIEDIRSTVKSFTGLSMRLEEVYEENGVKFYNDSASTNPDTTIAAIKSFTNPIILIAGGSSKGANYEILGQEIDKNNIKAVILMGKTGPEIKRNIKNTNIEVVDAQSLSQAVNEAKCRAVKGDVIVFSPASASFDMFRDYRHRGEEFNSLIKQ